MDLNNYNAVLQQLASAPGMQERLQKQFALNAGMRVGKFLQGNLLDYSPLAADAGAARAAQIQALPYQVGSGAGQVGPGDPNYKGLEEHGPEMDAAIYRYVKSLVAPRFTLPQAPPLQ